MSYCEGRFVNPTVIGNEDLLSCFHFDCLDGVLTLLNQDQLDKVAEVSQTLHAAVKYARPRATKTKAEKFSLYQEITPENVNHYGYEFNIGFYPIVKKSEYQLHAFSMIGQKAADENEATRDPEIALPDTFSGGFRFRNIQWHLPNAHSNVPVDMIAPVDRKILGNILPHVQRFSFKSYDFQGTGIDDQFLDGFKGIGKNRSIEWIGFRNCAFDRTLSIEGRARFLSLILSAKPAGLFIDFPREHDINIFDEAFFRSYANAGAKHGVKPWLTICNSFTVTDELLSILACYDNLNLPSLILKQEQLIKMIQNRLEVRDNGDWGCKVHGLFTNDLMATMDASKYSVHVIGSDTGLSVMSIEDHSPSTFKANVAVKQSETEGIFKVCARFKCDGGEFSDVDFGDESDSDFNYSDNSDDDDMSDDDDQ